MKPFPKIGPRRTPGLDARCKIQRARVGHGLKNESISDEELGALKGRNKQYQGILKSSKFDDGKIDLQERIFAHKYMNRTSKMIYDFKHN